MSLISDSIKQKDLKDISSSSSKTAVKVKFLNSGFTVNLFNMFSNAGLELTPEQVENLFGDNEEVYNSFVFGKTVILSENFMNHVNTFTTWCLTAAMVGLGLNINLRELREKAAKPLLALTITSLLITIGTYWII